MVGSIVTCICWGEGAPYLCGKPMVMCVAGCDVDVYHLGHSPYVFFRPATSPVSFCSRLAIRSMMARTSSVEMTEPATLDASALGVRQPLNDCRRIGKAEA